MDRITKDAFFEILQAAVWQREPDLQKFSDKINYDELIREFYDHALLSMVADTVVEYCPLSNEKRDRIFRHMANMVQRHWDLDDAIADAFERLEAGSIKAVLLKGEGLSRLYPLLNTRATGDIDIFIGKANYIRAQKIIDQYCGIPEREITLNPLTIHGSAEKGDIDFEIHYLSADTAIPSIKEEYNAFMEKHILSTEETVDIHGRKVYVPSPTVNLVYVFEHLLKHLRYEGVGFRQFIDWLLLIEQWRKRGSNDEKWLHDTLIHFHIMDAWQVLGGILVYQLGLPETSFPFWKESKAQYSQGRNLQYIIDSENLGHGTAKSKGYYFMRRSLKRKLYAVGYYARFLMFEYRIFPYDTVSKVLHKRFKNNVPK